ncbi:uncharacterized protein LOC141913876 [Tubulanus polymorphus]|uniref:uncharacterized protein LOC141913876 n=1 Tax=Tubulanus polymorphus TaxID=672921 RepID=UPI003DA2A8FC
MTAARLSFVDQGLKTLPIKIIKKYLSVLEELDLTSNHIKDFRFLYELPNLNTLILDRNEINSHVKFPKHTGLHTLWLNHNNIENLGVFIQTVMKSFPNLKYLSLMNNPAAPSYFNGGSVVEWNDYRQFVVSRFPSLVALDDVTITAEFRYESERIYGRCLKEDEFIIHHQYQQPEEPQPQQQQQQQPQQSVKQSKQRHQSSHQLGPVYADTSGDQTAAAAAAAGRCPLGSEGEGTAPTPRPTPGTEEGQQRRTKQNRKSSLTKRYKTGGPIIHDDDGYDSLPPVQHIEFPEFDLDVDSLPTVDTNTDNDAHGSNIDVDSLPDFDTWPNSTRDVTHVDTEEVSFSEEEQTEETLNIEDELLQNLPPVFDGENLVRLDDGDTTEIQPGPGPRPDHMRHAGIRRGPVYDDDDDDRGGPVDDNDSEDEDVTTMLGPVQSHDHGRKGPIYGGGDWY